MRRREENDGGSLDSLLDTLTNVVGILVIVLVVTQMGVRDAVERLAETNPVDPVAVEEARRQSQQVRQEVERVQIALNDLRPIDRAEFTTRIDDLRRQANREQEAMRQAIQQRERAEREAEEAADEARRKAKQARQQIAENEEEREKLARELATALEKVSQLEAILDTTPPRTVLPAKVVNLPNPRPAPEGAKPIHFVCSQNKVYPLDLETLRETARKRAEFIVRSKRLIRDPAEGIDSERFLAEFNKTNLRDDFFDVTMTASGSTPRLVFTPRARGGFTTQAIEGTRSIFRRQLERLDPDQLYCRFFVCSDSFDIYVTARQVLSEHDLLAGWDPQAADWKYQTNLGGPIRLGPPPTADPKPKPKPAAPAKPSAPANVID